MKAVTHAIASIFFSLCLASYQIVCADQNLRTVIGSSPPTERELGKKEGKGNQGKEDSPAALIITDRTCTFLDANDPPGLVDATKSIRVINENRGVSKCSFTSVPNPTNDVITWDYMSTEGFGADGFGLFCCVNADGGAGTLTTDYVQTISPAGESTLTCKFDFDGITGDPFDGSIGKQTTFGCNDVYPQFERCC